MPNASEQLATWLAQPVPVNPEFADQKLAAAYAMCVRISAEYGARAMEGKLGSIRRNRNNWKSTAASECADAIARLDVGAVLVVQPNN